MPLLTGRVQRLPEIDEALMGRYTKIGKASWADVYFDLYRESCGEDRGDEEIMADAERRLEILERYREAERRGDVAAAREHCFLCGGVIGTMGYKGHQCIRKGKL